MAKNKRIRKNSTILTLIIVCVLVAVIAFVILWFAYPKPLHKYFGLKAHTWSDWTVIEQENCGDDGKKVRTCSVCNKKEEQVIKATGEHDWGEWKEDEVADCLKEGSKKRVCSVCKNTESETVPAKGSHTFVGDVCSVCGYDKSTPTPETVKSAALSIHFLELGNKYTGDSTLIKCGDTEVLIDAGSRKDSAATIKNYLNTYVTDGVLEYVIATHAHQDHIAGFIGNSVSGKRNGILYEYKVGTLIQFAGHNVSTTTFSDYEKAVNYAKGEGTTVYTAKECWYETGGAKKKYFLDDAKTVSMNILYNYYYDNPTNDENDYSVCMLLTNTVEDKTLNYLFTGDLEEKGESYLVDNNDLPEVELFKGGHHGSFTASTDKLLNVIKPKNVAVCCCCGTTEYTKDKNHAFPSQEFIDRVSKHTENIYCTTLILDYENGEYTSMNGNIVFYCESKFLKLYCSNNNTKLKDTAWFKENRVWNN